MPENFFVEIDSYQQSKYSNPVNGDICLTKKTGTSSYVSILCDGLGSGVEANVLASFTASMGLEYISSELSPIRSAELLMNALPVCPVRKISFSTFTIFHLSESRIADIIEHGKPSISHLQGKRKAVSSAGKNRQRKMGQTRTPAYTFPSQTGRQAHSSLRRHNWLRHGQPGVGRWASAWTEPPILFPASSAAILKRAQHRLPVQSAKRAISNDALKAGRRHQQHCDLHTQSQGAQSAHRASGRSCQGHGVFSARGEMGRPLRRLRRHNRQHH